MYPTAEGEIVLPIAATYDDEVILELSKMSLIVEL
jgi:hypothetical protein